MQFFINRKRNRPELLHSIWQFCLLLVPFLMTIPGLGERNFCIVIVERTQDNPGCMVDARERLVSSLMGEKVYVLYEAGGSFTSNSGEFEYLQPLHSGTLPTRDELNRKLSDLETVIPGETSSGEEKLSSLPLLALIKAQPLISDANTILVRLETFLITDREVTESELDSDEFTANEIDIDGKNGTCQLFKFNAHIPLQLLWGGDLVYSNLPSATGKEQFQRMDLDKWRQSTNLLTLSDPKNSLTSIRYSAIIEEAPSDDDDIVAWKPTYGLGWKDYSDDTPPRFALKTELLDQLENIDRKRQNNPSMDKNDATLFYGLRVRGYYTFDNDRASQRIELPFIQEIKLPITVRLSEIPFWKVYRYPLFAGMVFLCSLLIWLINVHFRKLRVEGQKLKTITQLEKQVKEAIEAGLECRGTRLDDEYILSQEGEGHWSLDSVPQPLYGATNYPFILSLIKTPPHQDDFVYNISTVCQTGHEHLQLVEQPQERSMQWRAHYRWQAAADWDPGDDDFSSLVIEISLTIDYECPRYHHRNSRSRTYQFPLHFYKLL